MIFYFFFIFIFIIQTCIKVSVGIFSVAFVQSGAASAWAQ